MKCTLKVPSGKGGRLRVLRCPCCQFPLLFPSFKRARERAVELGYRTYSIKRVKVQMD